MKPDDVAESVCEDAIRASGGDCSQIENLFSICDVDWCTSVRSPMLKSVDA